MMETIDVGERFCDEILQSDLAFHIASIRKSPTKNQFERKQNEIQIYKDFIFEEVR